MDYDDLKVNDLRKALAFTLKWEGNYVSDADDPGGATKWGISQKAYPNEDIVNLTRERAAEIYTDDYWYKAGCNELEYPLNAVVFDTAVNCGVGRATKWLRESSDVNEYMTKRHDHYVDIINKNTNLIKFAKGWWARMADLKKVVELAQKEANAS